MTWRRTSTYLDTLALADIKTYLRVTFNDDDALLASLIDTSLEYVKSYTQRPTLNTGYSDQYGEFSTFPDELVIGDTEPPMADPQVFYMDTGGVEQEVPNSQISYSYSLVTRAIVISVESPPDIQEDSFIRVDWAVTAVAPELAVEARRLLIANWYENREATVAGPNTVVQFGVNAILSPNSLVL